MRLSQATLLKFIVLMAVFSVILTGCAVLTGSQIKEVKSFSETTKVYTELPSALARSYGVLVRDSDLIEVSQLKFTTTNTTTADEAWQKLVKAYDKEQKFITAGDRMDDALAILNQYSQLLDQLVSDDYTDALGESSEKLAASWNSAIDVYNKNIEESKRLPQAGGNIAEAIRLSGGLFIRARQTKILKAAIEQANPLIQSLMKDVKNIADAKSVDYEQYVTTHLAPLFKNIANESGRLTVNSIALVYDDLSRARAGQALAKKVGDAANAYAAAHEALFQKTRERLDLKELLAEIKTLQSETKAAQDIKAKMTK